MTGTNIFIDNGKDYTVPERFAMLNRSNPVWRAFKAKWDGKSPRQGSKAHAEMSADAMVAQASSQTILDRVIAESEVVR